LLSSITIKNFALIEDVQLTLDEHFNIITGETGAGKSIILGALAMLIGKRADLSSMRDATKKCVIEGIFNIQNYGLNSFFESEELDYEPQTIIRREILPSGKSRAFINDTPVRLQQLAGLGEQLIDIHSQHQTLAIGNANYQYAILDAIADNYSTLNDYKSAIADLRALQIEYAQLKEKQAEAQKTYDYNLFLLEELQEAKITPQIQVELEEQQNALSNIEMLQENLGFAIHQFSQEDTGVLALLRQIKQKLGALNGFGSKYAELHERLTSCLVELEDLSSEVEDQQERIEHNPEALALVNDQLDKIYALQRKHQTDSLDELLQIQRELEDKVKLTTNAQEAVAKLKLAIEQQQKKCAEKAQKLYKNRLKVIPTFIQAVKITLANLGMPDTRLEIQLKLTDDFNTWGQDQMQWLFSANAGMSLNEISKAASGGELSRITLAVKSILAKYKQLPTLIFDEIDTGISGDIAKKMGEVMRQMSQKLQIVAITHLPQVAAKGSNHLKVQKETQAGKTQTLIKHLGHPERIEELAEMLGGNRESKSAMAHAEALLVDSAQQ
jgi:DNA repair protein RecN (Recombination protein N)